MKDNNKTTKDNKVAIGIPKILQETLLQNIKKIYKEKKLSAPISHSFYIETILNNVNKSPAIINDAIDVIMEQNPVLKKFSIQISKDIRDDFENKLKQAIKDHNITQNLATTEFIFKFINYLNNNLDVLESLLC